MTWCGGVGGRGRGKGEELREWMRGAGEEEDDELVRRRRKGGEWCDISEECGAIAWTSGGPLEGHLIKYKLWCCDPLCATVQVKVAV